MARQSASVVQQNFSGGLVTEASGLNFPENACTHIENCIIETTGNIERRLGYQLEPNGIPTSVVIDANVVKTGFLWRNVNNDGNIYLYVLQYGTTLYFFDVSIAGEAISANQLATTVDLTDFSTVGSPTPETKECQFAAGNGYLFVVHPYLDSFSCSYDEDTQVISTTAITITIRDFDGAFENVAVNDRPSSLTVIHNYNLWNQGWLGTVSGGPHSPVFNYITAFHTGLSSYPSNADIRFLYKAINTDGQTVNDFSSNTDSNISVGTTPAPKGYYILNAYDQDRETASGLSGLTTTTSGFQRASTVSFHAGRVFYSGVNFVGYGANIYFTQILDQYANLNGQFGQCYQVQDPTAADNFDLLSDDGGVIKIADCGTIYKLFSIQGALIVFASNGIWTITGSSGLGFTATDFSVNKLSNIRCISGTSFVDVLGFPMFWANEGIYTVRVDIQAGGLRVLSLTDQTIKSYYNDIPLASKSMARGVYNPQTFTVQWLFNSGATTTVDQAYAFDTILNFHSLLGCFFPWNVAPQGVSYPSIHLATVIDIPAQTTGNVLYQNKYLVTYQNRVSFAEASATDSIDWASVGPGYDSEAFFVSGYQVHGQGIRRFQPNYAYFYLDNTTASQMTVQGVWDFSVNTAPDYGRVTPIQNMITDGTTNGTVVKRLKFPGRGLVFQFRLTSVPGLPFNLIGWATYETAGGTP